VAPAVTFGVLALLAFACPQLLGNGKDMAHDAFLGDAMFVTFRGCLVEPRQNWPVPASPTARGHQRSRPPVR